ncbi:Mu transposase C-terminal domain-containing protein [Kitasatospora sp. NPDC087314]|uniref:Mu transposase C-terminal domain-containing protein n=1 Tax=Kitasatospora sp. NPDC087314 TaxID=3364068 RepID=UPI0037F7DF83
MGQVSAEQRHASVERLEQLREQDALTSGHVRVVADSLGVSERTVWRWLARESAPAPALADLRTGARARYELSETDREAFAFYRGNVLAVLRARDAVVTGDGTTAGAPVPDFLAEGWAKARPVAERTLYRAFEDGMTPAERAAWRTGESGRRAADVYLRRPDAPRGRVWEMDHKQLPLLVLPPRGAAISPWLTTVVDDGSRGLLGWALALYPNAGTVLTAMRMAMVHEPAVSPFGAVPERVRIDRGLEFAAASVTEVLGALTVVVHRLPAFTPHRKGKVERLNLTIEQQLLSQLPGFTAGPRDAGGRLYGPLGDSTAAKRDAESAAVKPMRIEAFAQRFAAWARWYNTERPHRALDGRAPVQAWREDEAPVQRIDAARLRHLLLAGTERKVGKDGVRFGGRAYVAPELRGRGGQVVEVRYMPHDDRWIEVYLHGRHLCTARPAGHLTAEQSEAFREHAREEADRLGRERRRASRRARRELAPMTGTGAAEPSRLVHPTDAAQAVQRAGQALLSARARTDLLGLTPVTDTRPER